jgi:hypothetical protein
MLRFLDGANGALGELVAGFSAQAAAQEMAAQVERCRIRWNALAAEVRIRAGGLTDPALRAKAAAVASALEETEFPEAPQLTGPRVEGRWHTAVRVKSGRSNRYGEDPKDVVLGVVDYRAVVVPIFHQLWELEFEGSIHVDTIEPFGVSDEESTAEPPTADVATAVNANFAGWLRSVDPDVCRAAAGKVWDATEGRGVAVYVFCVPKIASVSMVVKRLRKFGDALPEGSVYVCIADPEEAGVLARQGFGTILFPSGEVEGWKLTGQDRRPEKEDGVRIAWPGKNVLVVSE